MNKEEIKSPKEFLEYNRYGGYLPIYTQYSLNKFMRIYSDYVLESKREEIERKAYEAGNDNATDLYEHKIQNRISYDQWKESQKQE